MFSVRDFFLRRKLGYERSGIHQLDCKRYDPSKIEARDIIDKVNWRKCLALLVKRAEL